MFVNLKREITLSNGEKISESTVIEALKAITNKL